MNKRMTALRGKIVYCVFPALLLAVAVYMYATAFLPVSTADKAPTYSVFEIISELLEG